MGGIRPRALYFGDIARTMPILLAIKTIKGRLLQPHQAPPAARSFASPRPKPSIPRRVLNAYSMMTNTKYPMIVPITLAMKLEVSR